MPTGNSALEAAHGKFAAFLSTVKYSEDSIYSLNPDEVVLIDLYAPEFSPLPGDVKKLNNCYSMDPVEPQARNDLLSESPPIAKSGLVFREDSGLS